MRDVKKFEDEDDEFDYGDEEAKRESTGNAPSYPFAAADSGALVFSDVSQLHKLVRLLTWEQYDLSLRAQGDAVIGKIVEALRRRRDLHYSDRPIEVGPRLTTR